MKISLGLDRTGDYRGSIPKACNQNSSAPAAAPEPTPTLEQLFWRRVLGLCAGWLMTPDQARAMTGAVKEFEHGTLANASIIAKTTMGDKLPQAHGVYMAATLGIMRALFALIRTMEPYEARFVLEEVNHETQKTVDQFQKPCAPDKGQHTVDDTAR